jgi:hypothetical protein
MRINAIMTAGALLLAVSCPARAGPFSSVGPSADSVTSSTIVPSDVRHSSAVHISDALHHARQSRQPQKFLVYTKGFVRRRSPRHRHRMVSSDRTMAG